MKTRSYFLISVALVALVFMAAPVRAEDNVIKVINEDGSVSTLQLPGEPAPAPEAPPPQQAPTTLQAPAPGEGAVPEAVSPAPAESIGAPVKKSGAKKSSSSPAPRLQGVSKRPVPPAPFAAPPSGPRVQLAPGITLTREEAMAIAIESTPVIASGMEAYTRTINNRLVWVVEFRTDNGPLNVLVDASTGQRINANGEPVASAAPARPAKAPVKAKVKAKPKAKPKKKAVVAKPAAPAAKPAEARPADTKPADATQAGPPAPGDAPGAATDITAPMPAPGADPGPPPAATPADAGQH